MRSSEIRLIKLKLRLRDKHFANHKTPCTAIWQQLLQSVLALRGCSAMDLINLFIVYYGLYDFESEVQFWQWFIHCVLQY